MEGTLSVCLAEPISVFSAHSSDALKVKLQENGKSCSNFNPKAFFNTGPAPTPSLDVPPNSSYPTSAVPPRLLSDQLINIFFQEWAPVFPVLHRPTFLQLYADYTADPDSVKDLQSVAQLYLVFSIAAISAEVLSIPSDRTAPL